MSFKRSLNEGFAKKVRPDIFKAKSLIKASQEAIATANKIPKEAETYKSIIRELYEGLRQYCEAIGFIKGYKFLSHETITYFIDEILGEVTASSKFDKYRKIRNGINYYGNDVSPETVNDALRDIPEIIRVLSKHIPLKLQSNG